MFLRLKRLDKKSPDWGIFIDLQSCGCRGRFLSLASGALVMCAQIIKILLWSGFEPPTKVLTPLFPSVQK